MCNSKEAPEHDCSDVIYLVYGARREGVGQKILVLCRIIADYHYQRPSGPVSVILGVFFSVNTPVWADIPSFRTTMAPTNGKLRHLRDSAQVVALSFDCFNQKSALIRPTEQRLHHGQRPFDGWVNVAILWSEAI